VNRRVPQPAEHGGRVRRLRTEIRREILDFSANFNPYPPTIEWTPDVSRLGEYPDDTYIELKESIGRIFHRDPDEICVGNGSVELIRAFSLATLGPGDQYYIYRPTFGEYTVGAQIAGAGETRNASEAAVRFICNPNNPTGRLLTPGEIMAVLDECRTAGATLFLDEAFIELASDGISCVDLRDPHLFVLRSITKSFSVPGLRFGYGFGDPDLISQIEVARPPWSVNIFAEQFAMEAFRHYSELEESRRLIAESREALLREIRSLGLSHEPPSANFILVHLPVPASPLVEKLVTDHGILVRDCTSFGLPSSIRIAVRRPEENRQLLEALAECLP